MIALKLIPIPTQNPLKEVEKRGVLLLKHNINHFLRYIGYLLHLSLELAKTLSIPHQKHSKLSPLFSSLERALIPNFNVRDKRMVKSMSLKMGSDYQMKILISGGAGFIGSHVAEYYASEGKEVVVFDNLSRAGLLNKNSKGLLYNWNYLKEKYPKVSLIKGDIRKLKEFNKAGLGVDVIVHVAAQVAVTTSMKDPRTDFEINTAGAFNALEVARTNDASVVFTSTNKVYGENVNRIPVVEKETRYEFADAKYRNGIPEDFSIDLTGHSPYGCSKLAADIYVQDYAHTYGLKTGVFRMSCIYGERQFGVEDQGWVAWFIIATLTGKPVTIYGNGKQVRDVLHVSDLIQVFDKFLASNIKHEVYNIGGGPDNSLSLIELLGLIEKFTNKTPRLTYADWRTADQKVYISDITKAKELMKWIPKITPSEGVRRLIEWVSSNRNLFS
jgi:CDP-paratose 2-epimerase